MSRNDDDRQTRLAAALRDNLRRRKAQARAEDDLPAAAETGADPPAPPPVTPSGKP